MDTSDERLALAEESGCNVINADAARDESLEAVRIAQAKTVLVSAGRDRFIDSERYSAGS